MARFFSDHFRQECFEGPEMSKRVDVKCSAVSNSKVQSVMGLESG